MKNRIQDIRPSVGYTINIHLPGGKIVSSYFGSQIFETKEDALKYVERRKKTINPFTGKLEIPNGSIIEIEPARFDSYNPYYAKHYERHTHEEIGSGGGGHKNIKWDMDEFETNKEIPPLKSPHKFIKNTSLLERKKKKSTKPKQKRCRCKK